MMTSKKGIRSMMKGFSEITTIKETPKYLKIGESTLYKTASKMDKMKEVSEIDKDK
jgi:hypothetical protein